MILDEQRLARLDTQDLVDLIVIANVRLLIGRLYRAVPYYAVSYKFHRKRETRLLRAQPLFHDGGKGVLSQSR